MQAEFKRTQSCSNYLTLKEMVCELEKFAPLDLAESWDNVGLLAEPSTPRYSAYDIVV